MILKSLIKTTFVVSSFVAIQAAQAALVSCPSSFVTNPTSKVEDPTGTTTAVSACQYLDNVDNNNNATLANINTAGFFGTTTWTVNGGNLQVDGGGGASGTWSIAGADFTQFDYAIIFKDGQDTNLVGFLFNELFSSGTWTTPFTEPPFDFNGGSLAHGVSHYTIVQRPGGFVPPGGGETPEPGILALMGLGMAGFLAARRRSVKK